MARKTALQELGSVVLHWLSLSICIQRRPTRSQAPATHALVNVGRSFRTAPAVNEKEPRHEHPEHRNRRRHHLPNESLERTVSLTDRDALKKLKKRVTNILNDAIDAAPLTEPTVER